MLYNAYPMSSLIELSSPLRHREFVRDQKYKTEAEKFGWSFVFQDFVSDELKSKVTQTIQVLGFWKDLSNKFIIS